MRPPPAPPRPDLVRKPQAPFGWLEAHLLHDHWLQRLKPDATAVLLLLALAADRKGCGFLGMSGQRAARERFFPALFHFYTEPGSHVLDFDKRLYVRK